jgi:acyl dehydratase
MTTTVNGLEEIISLAGEDLGLSNWLLIEQERINEFAEATGDHQWIHVDPARAADGPFGRTIAHGHLTLSLVVPLVGELLDIRGVSMTVNYGLGKVRFPSPVPVGSRIRVGARVETVDRVPGNGVQTCIAFTVHVNGSNKPACVGQVLYRHYA